MHNTRGCNGILPAIGAGHRAAAGPLAHADAVTDSIACGGPLVPRSPAQDRPGRGIAFGMILEPLDMADRAYMMQILPAPARMLYPFLIDRPWEKYASMLCAGT